MRRYCIPSLLPLLFSLTWVAHFLCDLDTDVQTWQIFAFFLIFTLAPVGFGFLYGHDLAKEDKPC